MPVFRPTVRLCRTGPRWPKFTGRRNRTSSFRSHGARQLQNVDFMVKDNKRFADSGGWGYAVFEYDGGSDTSGQATQPARPRKRTTRSVGSRVTRRRKQGITFSPSTARGEAADLSSARENRRTAECFAPDVLSLLSGPAGFVSREWTSALGRRHGRLYLSPHKWKVDARRRRAPSRSSRRLSLLRAAAQGNVRGARADGASTTAGGMRSKRSQCRRNGRQ